MKGSEWTYEELVFLGRNYPFKSSLFLQMELGRSAKAINSKAKVLGLQKFDPIYFRTLKNRKWTKEKEEKLVSLYQSHTATEISNIIGLSHSAIKNRANILGLGKKENKGCFPKGNVPVNKGKKMDPELKKRISHTFFKKGHTPANTLYDGAIRPRKDQRTGVTYLYLRISEANWVEYHRHIWEKHHGPIDKGMCVAFKDGNTANCSLNNLELISQAENMKRNTIHRYPEDLKAVIMARGVLNRHINKLTKNLNNQENE